MAIGFLCGSAGKEIACNAGGLGSMPGLGRSHGEGKGYTLQNSGLENSMDCISIGLQRVPMNEQLSLTHSKSLWTMIAAMKLKDACSLEEKL